MIVRTGKFFSPAVTATLLAEAQTVARIPVILLTQRHLGPHGKDEATLAQERFNKNCDAQAVMAGMPPPEVDADGDVVHYGCDFETGEILGWAPDETGENES